MARWIQVGKVMSKKAPKVGNHVAMGDSYKKLDVTITVTNEKGNVVATAKNPFLQIQDPRKRPGITEEQAAKIPAFIKQELSIVVED